MYSGTPLFRTTVLSVLIKGGVLISGIYFCILLYVAGTILGILIILKGDVLISARGVLIDQGVPLYYYTTTECHGLACVNPGNVRDPNPNN